MENARVRVLHCFRSPIGGLFRHVADLARAQYQLGISVGLVCDSLTGNKDSDVILHELAPKCGLGIHRMAIHRRPGLEDYKSWNLLRKLSKLINPDIIHGHGAKGGAFARLIAKSANAKAVYTPHGGSLHYSYFSPTGCLYLVMEKILKYRTDGMIFESHYTADNYVQKIGGINCPYQIIHNGLHEDEYIPASVDNKVVADFLFIGELRKIKGVHSFIEALNRVNRKRKISALIIGEGPMHKAFHKDIHRLGLQQSVRISAPIYPARKAFSMGRCLVVPSLAESFPYIVLEAAAAAMPMIATHAGGIGEIFGPYEHKLIPPNNPDKLAESLMEALDNPSSLRNDANMLKDYVHNRFTVTKMALSVAELYNQVLRIPMINASALHQPP